MRRSGEACPGVGVVARVPVLDRNLFLTVETFFWCVGRESVIRGKHKRGNLAFMVLLSGSIAAKVSDESTSAVDLQYPGSPHTPTIVLAVAGTGCISMTAVITRHTTRRGLKRRWLPYFVRLWRHHPHPLSSTSGLRLALYPWGAPGRNGLTHRIPLPPRI